MRPFLTKGWIKFLRLVLGIYIATFLLLLAGNIPRVGTALLEIQDSLPFARWVFGAMGGITALGFFLLFALCLYHYFGGPNKSDADSPWWLWIVLLLNFVGVVLYYLLVIEREHRAVIRERNATIACS